MPECSFISLWFQIFDFLKGFVHDHFLVWQLWRKVFELSKLLCSRRRVN
jgi:hypothetical protein